MPSCCICRGSGSSGASCMSQKTSRDFCGLTMGTGLASPYRGVWESCHFWPFIHGQVFNPAFLCFPLDGPWEETIAGLLQGMRAFLMQMAACTGRAPSKPEPAAQPRRRSWVRGRRRGGGRRAGAAVAVPLPSISSLHRCSPTREQLGGLFPPGTAVNGAEISCSV